MLQLLAIFVKVADHFTPVPVIYVHSRVAVIVYTLSVRLSTSFVTSTERYRLETLQVCSWDRNEGLASKYELNEGAESSAPPLIKMKVKFEDGCCSTHEHWVVM